jgi:diacylglycerol O-acyltransferase
MRQLSGQDASFVYMESARTPMHIGALGIYDPSTAPGGRVRFEQILGHIASRLHTARAYRQRLLRVPFELDYPYWIDDRDFDLEFHVRHIALPQPGDWRQLCIQVARLHSQILDRSRPLWELYVIEGLDRVPGVPPGAYGIFTKIHHAAVDGVSGTEITATLHDPTPAPGIAVADTPWAPQSEPSTLELMTRTASRHLSQPFELARALANAAPAFIRTQVRLARHDLERAPPAPRTRFNGSVSAHRVFEGRTFPLEAVKQFAHALPGATINDAVVAVCGGAVRAYLDAHGELPVDSLIAMAPINVRATGDSGSDGNRVSGMSISLCSDVEDPLARLAAVHASARRSKALSEAYGRRTLPDLNEHLPAPTLALAGRLATRLGVANAIEPLFNAVVSNVPGPQIPLYMNGARLLRCYGLGPVVDGMALFMPVLSYDGGISISVTSCRERMSDPEFFGLCIERALDDALAALT